MRRWEYLLFDRCLRPGGCLSPEVFASNEMGPSSLRGLQQVRRTSLTWTRTATSKLSSSLSRAATVRPRDQPASGKGPVPHALSFTTLSCPAIKGFGRWACKMLFIDCAEN